jgi:hypothetical protein
LYVYACYIHIAQHRQSFLPESLAALPIVYSKHILYTRIIETNSTHPSKGVHREQPLGADDGGLKQTPRDGEEGKKNDGF